MNSKISWFGIDFGTTNSAAFSFTGTSESNIQPLQYGDDEGRPYPSIVAINKETGEVITGRDAKNNRNSLFESHEYFDSIKSIIDKDIEWEIGGKTWTPEDIAAEIFKAIKNRVETNALNIIEEAVVAVPVGFKPSKKYHLRNAAAKAGINIKMFVSEPTAAFCSNLRVLSYCKNVAVFDWGGGTLDVVVLRIENGQIKELSSEGMSFAGNDIDRIIAEKIHAKFMRNKEHTISFDDLDASTKDKIYMKCEKAKCDFEDEDIITITMNRYGKYGVLRESMDYDYFALLIENYIDKAIKCLERAIQKANLNEVNIDTILCVGGSSKLRPLREKMNSKYGLDRVYYPDKVMWDIAKGAAIVSTRKGGYSLGKSIGILLSDGSYLPLLSEGQVIPSKERKLKLGIVEGSSKGSNEARFVFTDSENEDNRDFEENFILPLRGFVDEYINLAYYVDQDNVFKIKVGSNRMLEDVYRVWMYDNLKVSFNIKED